MYSDSIFKYLPAQLEEIGFEVHALPGASVEGRKKIGDYIQKHVSTESPDVVILHVGTNDLPFLQQYPGFIHSTVKQHVQLIKKLRHIYSGCSVIVSLPLPRLDGLDEMRSSYCHCLSNALTGESVGIMSWDDFPTDHLSMDLLHPSAELGLASLHWSLLKKLRTVHVMKQATVNKNVTEMKPASKPVPVKKNVPEIKPASKTKPVSETKQVAELKPVSKIKPASETKEANDTKPVPEKKTPSQLKPEMKVGPVKKPGAMKAIQEMNPVYKIKTDTGKRPGTMIQSIQGTVLEFKNAAVVIPYAGYLRTSSKSQKSNQPQKKVKKSPPAKLLQVPSNGRRIHGGGDPDLDSMNEDLAQAVNKVKPVAPQLRSSRIYKEKGKLRIKVRLADKKEFSRYFNVCDFDKVPDFCKYGFLEWVSGKLNVACNEEHKLKPEVCTEMTESVPQMCKKMENTDIKVSNSEGIHIERKQEQKGECVETLPNSVEIEEGGKTNTGSAIAYSHIEETQVVNDIDFKANIHEGEKTEEKSITQVNIMDTRSESETVNEGSESLTEKSNFSFGGAFSIGLKNTTLGLDEAIEFLLKAEEYKTSTVPATQPHGGHIFLFYSGGEIARLNDWRCDQYRWGVNNGNKKRVGKSGQTVIKCYHKLNKESSFQRHAWWLLDNPHTVLIQYIGKPHGNSVTNNREHHRTCPSVFKAVKEKPHDDNITTYQTLIAKECDNDLQAVLKPRNLKQV